jgi:hypothetical protein
VNARGRRRRPPFAFFLTSSSFLSARLDLHSISGGATMKRVLVLAIASAVILPFVARAQTKSDFSGTWALDVARSDPPMGRGGRGGPAGPVTLVIKQTADTLVVETRRGDVTKTSSQGIRE